MPRKSPTLALVHILDAIENLESVLDPSSPEALSADWLRRAAAERMLEIVSEASRRFVPRKTLPSAGDILKALSASRIDGDAYDRALPERIRSSLY